MARLKRTKLLLQRLRIIIHVVAAINVYVDEKKTRKENDHKCSQFLVVFDPGRHFFVKV